MTVTLYLLSHLILSTSICHKNIASTYRWESWGLCQPVRRSIFRVGTKFSLTTKPINFLHYNQICDIVKRLHNMLFLLLFSSIYVPGWVIRRRKRKQSQDFRPKRYIYCSFLVWLYRASQYCATLFISSHMERVLCFKQSDLTALLVLSYLISLIPGAQPESVFSL